MDGLGRIVLPKQIREFLDLYSQDGVEIYLDRQEIIIEKYMPRKCVLCDQNAYLIAYKEKILCQVCIEDIAGYVKN
ncbi:AbrB/MazE/SpoVT family DNA-binding domain-containing protein [Polycladospora coralii]